MGLLLAGLLLLSGCTAATSTEPEPQPQEQQISQQVVAEQSTAEEPEEAIAEDPAEQSTAEEPEEQAIAEEPEEQAAPQLSVESEEPDGALQEEEQMKMQLTVGEKTFEATLEKNSAVQALVQMMEQEPITIQMSDYAGFEKVGALGVSLPTQNSQTTTAPGDIVLYQGNQIVLFYGSNSWSYTRLGKIDDLTGWEQALGDADVTVTFSLEESR